MRYEVGQRKGCTGAEGASTELLNNLLRSIGNKATWKEVAEC